MSRLRSDDWLLNRLEVSGPQEPLLDFLQAASGCGFIDWRPDWNLALEHLEPRLARQLRDRFWTLHEDARSDAERNQFSIPLDLNALIPVPQAILRRGYYPDGRRWCWEHWGTEAPLRKVTFNMETRRLSDHHVAQVGVFEFLSLDWSPSRAVLAMRARWPGLRFALKPLYSVPLQVDSKAEKQKRQKQRRQQPKTQRRAA